MADETSKIDSNQKHCLMGVTNAATPELRNIKVAAATGRVLVSATVSGITTITVANEATDTTCFPLFTTAATGDLGPKTNAGLTFNSNTGSLGATLMTTRKISLGSAGVATGSIEINGTTSGTVTLKTADAAGTYTLTLPTTDGDANQLLKTDGSGVLSWADAAGGVPTAITVAVEAVDTECFLGFFTAATGDLGPKTNGGLKFNSATETISVTNLTATQNIIGTVAITSPLITAGGTNVNLKQDDTAANCGVYEFRRERDGDPTSNVADNDYLGQINFKGYNTAAYYLGASIRAVVNGTPGVDDMPTELIFATAADGSATPTDRMSISAAGLVNISGLTASEIVGTDANKNLVSLAVATYPSLTELSYVKGVTSAIQTQIGNKANSASPTFTGTVTLPKTLEIQDTSADHQYVLAVSELTADRTITLPLLTGTDTFVFQAHTQTLTNKRITQRVTTTTDDATAVIDIDSCDTYELSAVANNTEFTTTGTPTDGQKLTVRIKDAGVAKNLTWTGFTAIGITLPTVTVAGKWMYVGCIYNSSASAWHAVAYSLQA